MESFAEVFEVDCEAPTVPLPIARVRSALEMHAIEAHTVDLSSSEAGFVIDLLAEED